MYRKKFSDPLWIISLVFGIVGIVFTVTGVIMYINIDSIKASPNSHGNVEVLPYVFGGLGILFLLIVAVLVLVSKKKDAFSRYIIENGIRIYAEVTDVETNYMVSINSRHPYVMICTYTDPVSGTVYTFKSGSVMSDVRMMIGQKIEVYLNPGDYTQYFVNTYDL